MTEDEMILLSEQKESAQKALDKHLSEEQRNRLKSVIEAIDDEIWHSYMIERSLIIPRVGI